MNDLHKYVIDWCNMIRNEAAILYAYGDMRQSAVMDRIVDKLSRRMSFGMSEQLVKDAVGDWIADCMNEIMVLDKHWHDDYADIINNLVDDFVKAFPASIPL